MSFTDIINQAVQTLEEGNSGNDKVQYPKTKHKPLYFDKNTRELLIQVLPSKDLVSMFAVGIRRIFLSAVSSQGKQINSNFTLDFEPNPGSLLEQKIAEWQQKQMIPNGFGGQRSPRRLFLVNAVRVIQNPDNPQQWVQERDQQGNLVVRKFEMPQSAFQNLLKKLSDPLYNVSGTELSFMDINRPSPIKVAKPAKGQMEYPVEVYSTIILPPLGQGWEDQLEDLHAHAVPTERLVNGDKWVQAFIDMKEGRKPNQHKQENDSAPQASQEPAVNPYADLGAAPQAPVASQPQAPQDQFNPFAGHPDAPVPTPASDSAPQNDYSNGIGQETNIDTMSPTGMTGNQAPTASAAPTAPAAPNMPAHANSNGLQDIDAMLAKELGNL